jgi:hypothetical protein
MACNVFAGQGEVLIAKLDSSNNPIGGFVALGNMEQLTINTSVERNHAYESTSGKRTKCASWTTQTDQTSVMEIRDFNLANILFVTQGVDSGSVAGASVTDEATGSVYQGEIFYTAYPGISAVSITSSDGLTSLVEGTDYDIVDANNGGIKIKASAPNVTDGDTLLVDYTHVGLSGAITMLTGTQQRYAVRFNGKSMTDLNTPLIVELPVVDFQPAEELSFLSTDGVTLSLSGDILSEPVISFANSVA